MSEAAATLEAARGESLRADQIESAVKSAGFTPRGMTATAVGVVYVRGEDRILRWEDSDSEVEILLLGANAPDEGTQRVRVTGMLVVERDKVTHSVSFAMTVDETEVVAR